MSNKDDTYCSIIDGNCNERRRKECHRDCKAYKQAVKEAYNKTMEMIYQEYEIQKPTNQKQLSL